MLPPEQVEELLCLVATFDRPTLTHQFMTFRGSFPVDFTAEFLSRTPLERLRHIFVALCLQNQQLPESAELVAA